MRTFLRRCRGLRAVARLAACVAACLAGFPAHAGTFSVSPVRVDLSAAEPIAALIVRNGGSEAAVVQLEAMAWSQQDGADRYEASRDLIATPPIFTVPAGGSQIVRVGTRRGVDPRRELTYRLYLQEVPAPTEPGFTGMRVALRLGVPVFVAPAVKAAPLLKWQVLRSTDGALALACTNDGAMHARIVSLSLASTSSTTRIASSKRIVASDLHAGQQRRWTMPGPLDERALPVGTPLRLAVVTEHGTVDVDLVVP
ncbi:hypothetical protein BH09PSE5_BH09PSE5_00150 [soil metagenome]